MDTFFFLFAALFSMTNPIGVVPIFVGLTSDESPAERNRIALWTAINVFIILLVSFLAGKYVLEFFGITMNALNIAGGLIIVGAGFSLLTKENSKKKNANQVKEIEIEEEITKSDISLTPLAIPMLAGPGAISLLINHFDNKGKGLDITAIILSILALIALGVLIYTVLRSAHFIAKFLGDSGINAITKIIGFIVVAIGIQIIMGSVLNLFESEVFPDLIKLLLAKKPVTLP